MNKDCQTIVKDIEQHLSVSGKRYYSDFFIGIANDAEDSLFKQHHVSKDRTWWIYRTAIDADNARRVKDYFAQKGMRNDGEATDGTSQMVYCYAVTPKTVERV